MSDDFAEFEREMDGIGDEGPFTDVDPAHGNCIYRSFEHLMQHVLIDLAREGTMQGMYMRPDGTTMTVELIGHGEIHVTVQYPADKIVAAEEVLRARGLFPPDEPA